MCGRYLIDDDTSSEIELMMMQNTNAGPLSYARGEIFPTNIAPVITQNGMTAIRWGFPHWKNNSVIINARAETALEKSMFRKPLLEQRCAIPSAGYYEWTTATGKKKKYKYLFKLPQEKILYMAGMLSFFRDPAGIEYNAFVILTTASTESVSQIHDRMPVVLMLNELSLWINEIEFAKHVLQRTGPELEFGLSSF